MTSLSALDPDWETKAAALSQQMERFDLSDMLNTPENNTRLQLFSKRNRVIFIRHRDTITFICRASGQRMDGA